MKTLFISWGLAAVIVLLWPRVPSFQQATLPADGAAAGAYGTARAAVVLCAVRQMPHR